MQRAAQKSDPSFHTPKRNPQSGINRTQNMLELRQARARLRSIRRRDRQATLLIDRLTPVSVTSRRMVAATIPCLRCHPSRTNERRVGAVSMAGDSFGNYRKSTPYHVSFVPGSREDVYSATRASNGRICRGHRLCSSCGRSCRNSDCLADSSSQPAILRPIQGLQNRQPHDLIFFGNR
jgi:hypothetical protein